MLKGLIPNLGIVEPAYPRDLSLENGLGLSHSQVISLLLSLLLGALKASSLAHLVTFLAPFASASFFFRSVICSFAIFSWSLASSRRLAWSLAYFWALTRPNSTLSLALVISFKSSFAFKRSALEFLRVRVASRRLSRSSSKALPWSLATSSNL